MPRCASCIKTAAEDRAAARLARRAEERKRLERACIWCLKPFTATYVLHVCCSKVCRSRLQSKIRKQRLKGLAPTVIPVAAIYVRDRGRCGLCRRHVPRTKKYPHPMAPTVDHIVPITKGGEHILANVQLAHALCNLAKSNRACGSQLKLFA